MFGVRERGGGGVLLRDRGGDVDFVELYADGGGRRAVISARERKEREELRNRHQVYQYEDETGRIVDGMEWITTQHLDLSPGRAGAPSVQPHCAAFHHSQALFAAAVGRHIIGTHTPISSILSFQVMESIRIRPTPSTCCLGLIWRAICVGWAQSLTP